MNQDQEKEIQDLYKKNHPLEKLYTLTQILRKYCPWDKEQTLESLQQSLLEEAYEVIQGIQEKDVSKRISVLKEELGDILFLVHFLILICEELNYFDLNSIYNSSIEKLIQRHPHIFSHTNVKTTKDVLKNWESFKQKKFGENTEFLPALLRAQKIQTKASLEGFDWQRTNNNSHIKEIFDSIKKEIEELEQELLKEEKNQSPIELELGDVLFSIVNLARHLEVSAEISLHRSIDKFISRFQKVIEIYKENYKDTKASLQILEKIYQNIKKKNGN
ncbi:MAG: nucleoside triphosphate pyrophosphohydrolase [Leptonema sp. (in: bacteria)]